MLLVRKTLILRNMTLGNRRSRSNNRSRDININIIGKTNIVIDKCGSNSKSINGVASSSNYINIKNNMRCISKRRSESNLPASFRTLVILLDFFISFSNSLPISNLDTTQSESARLRTDMRREHIPVESKEP